MVRAFLRDGTVETVHPDHGDTVKEMIARLTAGSLTGSAVPLAGARLTSADGRSFAYEDVNLFQETTDF